MQSNAGASGCYLYNQAGLGFKVFIKRWNIGCQSQVAMIEQTSGEEVKRF